MKCYVCGKPPTYSIFDYRICESCSNNAEKNVSASLMEMRRKIEERVDAPNHGAFIRRIKENAKKMAFNGGEGFECE